MATNGATLHDIEMFGSDDEGGAAAAARVDSDQDMEGLFGDEDNEQRKDDISRGTSPTPSVLGDGLSAAERRSRKALEYEEEDEPQAAVVREAELPIPNIPIPHSADGNHWVIRMPNFVKFDSQPFHPDTYRGPEAELDAEGQAESLKERSMSIKLEVENTIRWKWVTGADGKKIRQSNSRVIKWSDGSMSLQLGKELFDISVNVDTSATAARAGTAGAPPTPGPNSQSQSQTQSSQGAPLKSSSQLISNPEDISKVHRHQGLSYLVAQHKTSAILQVETPVTGFLSLRPTGMHSETHRKLVRAVGQKHSKVARLRLAHEDVASRDPSAMSAEAQKAAKKKARASAGTRRPPADDDDSDGGYEKARRRQRSSFNRNRSSKFVYSDDDDEAEAEASEVDDDDERGSPKKRRTVTTPSKKGKDKDPAGDYEADDFVVEDEPSDAEEEDSSRRARRDTEPDLLDKIDRDIEDQTRRRRKEAAGVESGDVDVESEGMDMSESGDDGDGGSRPATRAAAALDDDDDVPQVTRKPGQKKRIILEDDDDE